MYMKRKIVVHINNVLYNEMSVFKGMSQIIL